jgi:hypothetical protein
LWKSAGVEGSFRASVPPTNVLDFATAAGLSEWSADAAFGIVTGLAELSGRARLESAARSFGGGVYFIEGGRPGVRMDDGQRALMRRLKAAFDPEGKLEPLPELS